MKKLGLTLLIIGLFGAFLHGLNRLVELNVITSGQMIGFMIDVITVLIGLDIYLWPKEKP